MTRDMGGGAVPDLLASTRVLLLDFDGPVTLLMPDGVDRAIADDMRAELRRATGTVPAEIADAKDPLAVLRVTAATEPGDILALVEGVCRQGEVRAAERSQPTDGAHDAMRACHDAGRPPIIVSNNAADAIEVYLERHGIRDLVQSISARPLGQPELMKPDPYLLRQVFHVRAEPPQQYVFVGDSVSDVQVSRATGVRSIGYAKTADRAQALLDAGADAVIDRMRDLSDGIQRAALLS